MGSPLEDETERIPTYEESIQHSTTAADTKSTSVAPHSNKPSLSQSLINVRSERINTIITSYIDPLLESQVLAGLHKTTIALVPSNSHSIQTTSASQSDIIEGSGDSISHNDAESVIGFPDEDYVKLVRLHGEDYSLEFWRQPTVIQELEASLKARLAASGHSVYEPPSKEEQPVRESRSMPPIAKRGLFRKKAKEASTEQQSSGLTTSQQSASSTAPRPGQVKLTVEMQEISLRTVTDMGLYDTRAGIALVVKMEIGS